MESETVIACGCGAQVRLPNQRSNRSFRCPACKNALAVTLDTRVLSATQLAPGEPGSTCPICQTAIASDEFVVRCPDCDQVHHRECWSEIGGCGTYGCTQAPAIEKTVAPLPARAWGDTKQCPACGETIKSIALRCRYCNTDFDTTDPMTAAELDRKVARKKEQVALRAATIILFVLSLLGLTAPLAGLVASGYLLPKGEQLRRCGPLYSFLAWVTLVVSGIFTVMIAVFLIFEWT